MRFRILAFNTEDVDRGLEVVIAVAVNVAAATENARQDDGSDENRQPDGNPQ